MAKSLLDKAKTATPNPRRKYLTWIQKLPPQQGREVTALIAAYNRGELADNFLHKSELARWIIAETGAKVAASEIVNTITAHAGAKPDGTR